MTRRVRNPLWVGLGALLLGSAGPAAAQPIFGFTDSLNPASLAPAAAVFVKVDAPSGTDTLLVVNRQQVGDVTTTGTAIPVRLRFYDANCTLKFDNNVAVTPQGVAVNLVSTLFGATTPGVVLADTLASNPDTIGARAQFALSAVVIDGNFGAVYERQGAPLLIYVAPATTLFNWGGFSTGDLDDWFIGGFTMLQMMCPNEDSDLAADMHTLAAGLEVPPFFADFFPVVNVYDAKEVLKRSIHEVPCFCNTDSAFFGKDSRLSGYAGDFVDVLASMKAVGLGTFHWDEPTTSEFDTDPGLVRGWRVISAGAGSPVHWDAPLRSIFLDFATPAEGPEPAQ